MSNIDDLKAALATEEAGTAAGFQAIAEAMDELATDITGLNEQIQNPNVTEITAEIQAQSQANADKFTAVAQAIRDAVATPTPEPTP